MSYQLNDLVHLMACLSDSEYGCPWDRAHTYQRIVPFNLAAAYDHFFGLRVYLNLAELNYLQVMEPLRLDQEK